MGDDLTIFNEVVRQTRERNSTADNEPEQEQEPVSVRLTVVIGNKTVTYNEELSVDEAIEELSKLQDTDDDTEEYDDSQADGYNGSEES